jgi:hypothetical protein
LAGHEHIIPQTFDPELFSSLSLVVPAGQLDDMCTKYVGCDAFADS